MKVLIPFVVACTYAINLQEADTAAMNDQEVQKTIVGFVFEGFDFGDLWVGLTDDQRDLIKNSVFDMALTDAGYNAADFNKDHIFIKPATAVMPGAVQEKITEKKDSTRELWSTLA